MLCDDDYFHVHVFVPVTADYGANNLVFPWLVGNLQDKFLYTGLELEIPVRKLRAIAFAEQSEPVNGSVTIVSLGLLSRDAEFYLLAGLEG